MKERKEKGKELFRAMADFVIGEKSENGKRYICDSDLLNMILDFTFNKQFMFIGILWFVVILKCFLTEGTIGILIGFYLGGAFAILCGGAINLLNVIESKSILKQRIDLDEEFQEIKKSTDRLYMFIRVGRTICFKKECRRYTIEKLEKAHLPLGDYAIKFNKRGNASVRKF